MLLVEATLASSHVGLCKIIPPSGWFQRSYDNIEFKVKTPVKQVFFRHGAPGVYEITLFEKKSMKLHDFQTYDQSNQNDIQSMYVLS